MIQIRRFLGIFIGMFYRGRRLPHFGAAYGEFEITVEMETGVVAVDSLVDSWRTC